MPARIYALAKELNVDSKDLVDLVKKVGITGKGSALASLSDEETQKVRDHLASAGTRHPTAAPTETAPGAVRDAVPKERKPIAIKVGRSSGSRSSEVAAAAKVELPPPEPIPAEPIELKAVPVSRKDGLSEPNRQERCSALGARCPDTTRRNRCQWWRQDAFTRSSGRWR